MNLNWLTICAEGQTADCISSNQVAYLAIVLGSIVLFAFVAYRSRDLSTATLTLMPVAIAINIAVGAIVVALRLPIYLDSIGTVLVGVLAGPWAGALTGLLANTIWALLPIPGGAGPTIAFFAPVAGMIGLMAGFWAGRGVFRLRPDDTRVGGFLALALGVAAAGVALIVIQNTIGMTFSYEDADTQTRFVTLALLIVAIGLIVGYASGRTIFAFKPADPRARTYLVAAAALSAFAIVFALLRLLFSPNGYFSSVTGVAADGTPDTFLGGANLSGLALSDPLGFVGAAVVALVVGALAWMWASRGDNARLFPVWIGGFTTGLVAAAISAPIAAGVFGGVTGSGTDALVAIYRTLGLNIFQSAFAQGLTSDPLDKTISFTIVFAILTALPLTVRTMFTRGEAAVAD